MADEYIANLNVGSQPVLDKIGRELSLTGRYVIERCVQDEVALRFSNRDRRPDWPEDAILNYDGQALFLTIHAASKLERDKLIQDVESVLKVYGMLVSFETI
jgi:hypothetical protein